MKADIKKMFFPVLNVLFVAIFPAVFLFCQNADEAGFSEIVPAIVIFAFIGLLVFFLSLLITRSAVHSSIIASILILILTNFIMLEDLLKLFWPNLKYWHTVSIILVLGLHICYAVWRFLNTEWAYDIAKVLCLVFGTLILVNVVTSAPNVINRMQMERQLKNTQNIIEDIDVLNEKPNIYMFIFDEYANFPQMEEYYDYDNALLRDFLEKHNFSISYTSHNESTATKIIITNLVNLDYIVDDNLSAADVEVVRKKGYLFTLLKEHGYKVNVLETGNFLGGHMPNNVSAQSYASTINGENLLDLCMKNSIIYPFWRSDIASSIDKIMQIVDYMSTPECLPDNNTFTMVYLCFPHTPFLVNEDGHPIPFSQSANWEDKKYYLGQYKYATKIMIKMLDNIIQNDSNSIIILQSDHGARASTANGLMIPFSMEMMTNPLNAVYYQGNKILEIDGLSSVNTIRVVLNSLLRTDLSIIDVLQY